MTKPQEREREFSYVVLELANDLEAEIVEVAIVFEFGNDVVFANFGSGTALLLCFWNLHHNTTQKGFLFFLSAQHRQSRGSPNPKYLELTATESFVLFCFVGTPQYRDFYLAESMLLLLSFLFYTMFEVLLFLIQIQN